MPSPSNLAPDDADRRTHTHRCHTPGCGHVWQHGEEAFGDLEAHRCVRCGRVTTWAADAADMGEVAGAGAAAEMTAEIKESEQQENKRKEKLAS